MDILDKIKQLRDERGWSNYRLAKESHISEGSLNNLFRLNYLPTIPTLEAICKGFGISLSQFFTEGNEAVVMSLRAEYQGRQYRQMFCCACTLNFVLKSPYRAAV